MNYLRNFKNRFAVKLELVSALEEDSFLIDPPNGFTEDIIPVNYNGVYFTVNSANLSEKSKLTKAGVAYTASLDLRFPKFPEVENFKEKFRQLSEVKITFNTGEIVRLNKNDISLNRPIDAEFSSDSVTVGMSLALTSIFPLKFDE
ncbi:hypothetical protein [Chryseobacterium sp. Hurlbut01]|uniref:hypothetical protein n=1 Tax=Chryseobacterium sp. Hurlbut01 TaxID=1681828 RepID=UPI00067AF073|nr:hypothetical protein [Chryseobacterium sp. Hurlbut01]KNB61001.1 hypothetical protein AC804_17820 [Chryseobacterium sp. Hurlbut01]